MVRRQGGYGLTIGACFKIETGDIEEAPAWDALPCFKTSIDGNDVSVEINNLGIASLSSYFSFIYLIRR